MRPAILTALLLSGCPYITDRDWPCSELVEAPANRLTTDYITQTRPVFEWEPIILEMGTAGANTWDVNAVTFTPQQTGEYVIALGTELDLRSWLYRSGEGFREPDSFTRPECEPIAALYTVQFNAQREYGIGLLFNDDNPETTFFIAPGEAP